ncbi:hypothetical protein, partial [Frigoribacterium sp. RIT-PI-h]|uniref:hypothetical protein n=1 Tax=Frigoribacterium sp. RIT-PI-h TaxID=1690245 RepID=UPI0006B8D099
MDDIATASVSIPSARLVPRVLVVGGGPAAHRLAEALAARATADGPVAQVTVVGEEVHLPYDRVALSTRLAGAVDLTLGAGSVWSAGGVSYLGGGRGEAPDRGRRTAPPA